MGDGSEIISQLGREADDLRKRAPSSSSQNAPAEGGPAEEVRRRSEDLLAAVFDASPNCIFVKDGAGRYVLVNRATADLHGVTLEEMIGKRDRDFIERSVARPGEVERFLEDDRQAIDAEERRFIPEETFTMPDGTVRVFQTTKIPLSLGDHGDCVLGIAVEITERKRVEEALRESKERFRRMAETSIDIIFQLDREGVMTYCSPSVHRYSGFTPEEVIGVHVIAHCEATETVRMTQAFQKVISGDTVREVETRLVRKDGSCAAIAISMAPIIKDGEVVSVQGVARDITDQKQAEDRLRTSHRVLRALAARVEKAREDERGKLARRIHDEIGHALAALAMDLAWLDRRLAEAGAPVDLQKVRERIKSMSGLVEETIRTAKTTASNLRPAVLDDLGLVAALEWEARQFSERTGVRCAFRGSLEEPDVDQIGSTALFRICQEMLTNVALHAKATRAEIALKHSDGKLVLEVKDDGVGISGEQASSSSSLGIIGMRERVSMLGGELSISRRRGRGTKVSATVPLRGGQTPRGEE